MFNLKIDFMKKRTIFSMGFIIAGALILSLSSCKKDNSTTTATTSTGTDLTSLSTDDATANNTSTDMQATGDQAMNSEPTKSLEKGAVDSSTLVVYPANGIKFDTTGASQSIVITWPDNTTCADGKIKSGSITISWTGGTYRDSGMVITYQTNGYVVNGNDISFTKTVKNLGHLSNPLYNVVTAKGDTLKPIQFQVTDTCTITKASNGGIFTWGAHRTRLWIAGYRTAKWWDDVYALEGHGWGKSTKGISYYHSTIVNYDVIKPIVTKCIISGQVQLIATASAADSSKSLEAIATYGSTNLCLNDKWTTWAQYLTAIPVTINVYNYTNNTQGALIKTSTISQL